MPFLRPVEYFENRFHDEQEKAWLGYKAGLDLVLPWGRRSGKSDLFSEILIEDVEQYGKDCLFVAKTQKQARRIIWKKFRDRVANNPDWKLNESSLEARHVPSGALIAIKGADLRPDDLAGSGYRIIACDEFALWKKPEIVGEILAPMLGDFTGQFLFGSTKRGKNHFHALHLRAVNNRDKYYVSECTIFANPFISDEGRTKVLSEYAGEDDPLYRQEILNEYVTFQGQVFAMDQSVYTEKIWDRADFDHAVHFRGIDLGYKPDPTAVVWAAFNERKGYIQIYCEYKRSELLIANHAANIKALSPWEVFDSYSDTDPQIIAEFENVGLKPISPANKADKDARLLSLVNALRTGKLKIAPNCIELLKEMAVYEWDQDGNDHLVDSLSYFWSSHSIPTFQNRKRRDFDDIEGRWERRREESSGQSFGENY